MTSDLDINQLINQPSSSSAGLQQQPTHPSAPAFPFMPPMMYPNQIPFPPPPFHINPAFMGAQAPFPMPPHVMNMQPQFMQMPPGIPPVHVPPPTFVGAGQVPMMPLSNQESSTFTANASSPAPPQQSSTPCLPAADVSYNSFPWLWGGDSKRYMEVRFGYENHIQAPKQTTVDISSLSHLQQQAYMECKVRTISFR